MTVMSRAKQLVLFTALSFPSVAFASGPKDFSGTYVEEPDKQKSATVVKITQTPETIEIRREYNGKETLTTLPLDGSPALSTTKTGLPSKGTAHWKGSDLIIESVTAAPPVNGKVIRLHQTEHWNLSKDGRTLKVRVETDSPDMPPDITAFAIPTYTVVFKRQTPTP